MRASTAADGHTREQSRLQRVRQGVQPDGRLDLKLLRLALHGWWLGNQLVYKPGTADLAAVARELAGAGARSGTLVLDDRPHDGAMPAGAAADTQDILRLVLILRPELPRHQVGAAVARAVAEVAQAVTGCSCAIPVTWEVALERGHVWARCCQVQLEAQEDVTLVSLRLVLGPLWAAARGNDQHVMALASRHDRREVVLARVLHRLEECLRPVPAP